jgi:hypothetical protein
MKQSIKMEYSSSAKLQLIEVICEVKEMKPWL